MVDEPVKSRGLDSKNGAKRDREKDRKRDPKNRDKDTKREGSQTPSGKGSLNKVKKHDGNFEDIARSAVPRSSAFRDTPRVSEPIKKKKQHKPPLEFESVIPPKPPAPTQNTHRQPMHAASASTSSATKIMTAYTSPQDIEMAESQLRIQSLHGEERVRQEKWAIEKLSHHGACPAGYKWHPYNKGVDTRGRLLDGYRCRGGNHMITHAIVAGGRNDYYCSAANLAFLVQLQWQCTALSPLQTPPPMRYPGMQAPLGMIMVLGQQQFQQVQMQQPMHFIQQPGQPMYLIQPGQPTQLIQLMQPAQVQPPPPPPPQLPQAPRPPAGYDLWYGPFPLTTTEKDVQRKAQSRKHAQDQGAEFAAFPANGCSHHHGSGPR
ncbi:uncharacterized protein L3040_001386 [Drepanopeziza brunnea f. sp. 'multigermtubi']|uniref:uncharacterized protein n=1 Tax=Drepanopeziza brunnea f. sp. 'multigermtubi' TaxID=698441 RepID=UPI00239B29BB|nr:hypothetical protein L3040_001386 [Drepanopeziza brunnea f. sp. 'multigermtubi']